MHVDDILEEFAQHREGLGPVIKEAMGRGAMMLQWELRRQIEDLVYSIPESPSYKRTFTLFRSAHVSPGGTNHDNDHDRAFARQDLQARHWRDAASFSGYIAQFDIGAYADWAEFVHEGKGRGNRPRKPFLEKTLDQADALLIKEIERRVASYIRKQNT